MVEKDNINTFTYIELRNNLGMLNVGQVVEIIGIENDLIVGKIEEIDLEAKGFWLSLETQIKGMEDWDIPNTAFFYEMDIKRLRVLS